MIYVPLQPRYIHGIERKSEEFVGNWFRCRIYKFLLFTSIFARI